MPALLTIARGAVVRAGFNTPWECIAAGTPFLPLIGTTYAEPVAERVNRMASLGLVPPNIESFWFESEWRTEYCRIAKAIVKKYSGVPEPHGLRRLILGWQGVRSVARPSLRAARRNTTTQRIPLVIRIDDVVCKEPALCWLLDLLAARGLHASLEVVPYLLRFDGKFLDRFDPSRELFEVSQHGYAHVPRTGSDGRRYEFSPESAAPTLEEVEVIARGKQQLEAAFPKRFTGGFSPPFDAMPAWLPAFWHSLGGAFVSCLYTNSVSSSPLPVRRAGVDVWDWTVDRPLSLERVRLKLSLQYSIDGHAGIVLHPRCLRRRADNMHLRSLLDRVGDSVVTVSLRDFAQGKIKDQARRPAHDPFWTAFPEIRDER
jgi:peptidoglycan/xylan/chitin deacetylase (PgdA/CDA1 family)